MGDWEDVFGPEGMKGDFAPWDNPCWNDDDEQELLAQGLKTLQEWNDIGRVVKKSEKGIYLRCARKTVFWESQTISRNKNTYENGLEVDFSTFIEAIAWAKNNPGQTITRSPSGKGFIKK